jgi:hypothetical protein
MTRHVLDFLSPPNGERIEVRGLMFQTGRLLTPALSSFSEAREKNLRDPVRA